MSTAVAKMDDYQALADAGQYAALADALQARPEQDVAASALLSLLYGTAQARLGRHDEGLRWVERAVVRARRDGDGAVERRALNARGGIAFVTGRLDEAADYFTQGLMAASRDADLAAVGRCSNNIGSIASLRGRHAEAVSSYQMAMAAFERAGLRRGVAECRHNLGITYGQQENFTAALAEADQAAAEGDRAGDRGLAAIARRGRAELRAMAGDQAGARQDVDAALAIHRELGDAVEEAQDQRIVASILTADGQPAEAERTLRDVIGRAEVLHHPQLVADASRDLAFLLLGLGRREEAHSTARAARAIFLRLGAEYELRKLANHDWEDEFATELRRSLQPLHEAQRLADAGRYAELVAYLQERSQQELEHSPTLALLYGIAHARLGRLELGQQWATAALTRARTRGDRALEVRALNVCGAIALERGGIGEATHFFTRAQQEAMQHGDLATVGRAANNLGIIANMQGDFGRAIGSYTMAIAAYQRAGVERGVAESEHNLGIAYREQGSLADALHAAAAAVRDATATGDRALVAQALAGRAEIRVAAGDPTLAAREAERALDIHRELGDEVRQTEDLRILALATAALGQTERAVDLLVDVVRRATDHGRPLLVAIARRDLAAVLLQAGKRGPARDAALDARAGLRKLGANLEVQKIDELLTMLS